MDAQIKAKMEALMKYVPFIDFIVKMDAKKYAKFVDIKKWIISRKRYPLNDLNKIEQSIITQYKNLMVLDDKKIPQEITKIFCDETKEQYFNLCSDDDEADMSTNKILNKPSKSAEEGLKKEQIKKQKTNNNSISHWKTPTKESHSKKHLKAEIAIAAVSNADLNDISADILKRIDQISKEDCELTSVKPKIMLHDKKLLQSPNKDKEKNNNLDIRNGKRRRSGVSNAVVIDTILLVSSDDDDTPSQYLKNNTKERKGSIAKNNEQKVEFHESQKTKENEVNAGNHSKSSAVKNNGETATETEEYVSRDTSNEVGRMSKVKKEVKKSETLKVQHVSSTYAKDENRKSETLKQWNVKEKSTAIGGMSKVEKQIQNPGTSITQNSISSDHKSKNINSDTHKSNMDQNSTSCDGNLNNPVVTTSRCKSTAIVDNTSIPGASNTLLVNANAANKSGTSDTHKLNVDEMPISSDDKPETMVVVEPTSGKSNTTSKSEVPNVVVAATSLNQSEAQHPKPNGVPNIPENKRRKSEQNEDLGKRQKLHELNLKDQDSKKIADDIRSILINTLQPYEGKIASMWELHKKPNDEIVKKSQIAEKENTVDMGDRRKDNPSNKVKETENDDINNNPDVENDKPHKDMEEENNAIAANSKANGDVEQREERLRHDRINRVFKELECSFKGYDQLQDYIPKCIGGKRRSSVHARTAIAEQLNANSFAAESKRRSSVHARSAIAEQLKPNPDEESLDGTDFSSCPSSPQSFVSRKGSIEYDPFKSDLEDSDINCSQSTNRSNICGVPKRRKTFDVQEIIFNVGKRRSSSVRAHSVIADQLNDDTSTQSSSCSQVSQMSSERKRPSSARARSVIANQLDEETTQSSSCSYVSNTTTNTNICETEPDSDSELNDFEKFRLAKIHKAIIENQPKVVLQRLTDDEIRKYTTTTNNILDVHLVESRILPITPSVDTKRPLDSKKSTNKRPPNNDSAMTSSNTTFCALCSSRPSDLTNHYRRIHKSESYVSRLTISQLDELSVNTQFAQAVTTSSASGVVSRYSITCPFCKDELNEPFMNLYNHYSTHTGEYAFQCSTCKLEKPFKADIQSHQLHSKTCRVPNVQILYRYPSNAMVIYLHYCNICNFVQLNEANVHRHLREHHDQRQALESNVGKCILVAISDAPDINTNESGQNKDDNQQSETNESMSTTDDMQALSNQNQINFLPDDDDIPVCNEAFLDETFDSATKDLDEQLKQIHEESTTKTTVHLPVIQSVDSIALKAETAMTPPRFVARQNHQKNLKPKPFNIYDNFSITPPRPSLQRLTTNHCLSKLSYRPYPDNVKYLGLYKCMADDCYYSTEVSREILQHFENHSRENVASDYLQCPYCSIFESNNNSISSSQQLIDHIREHHLHMIYQCSACCYRSCDASNVVIHQKESHPHNYGMCKVFKCPGEERVYREEYVKEKLSENVRKIQCRYCSHKSFYHSNLLEHHITTEHKVQLREALKNYSCIYCPLTNNDETSIRTHLALRHPEELPYICNHNNSVTLNEDTLHNLKTYSINQPVSFVDVHATVDSNVSENSIEAVQDIKPSAEELLKCQEETLRVKLRKLTEKTGIAPDSLYRCPIQTCGGFFSIYDLWLRHMRSKHHCLESQCPHCRAPKTLSLEDYETHFEKHRRHTFLCFHCSLTFRKREDAVGHASKNHVALGALRLEQIRFNLSYSYFILVQSEMLKSRSELVPALLDVLDSRLKELIAKESIDLKRFWPISTDDSPWLEDYQKSITWKLKKKCFKSTCDFRATDSEAIYQHVRENHSINATSFNCSHCDFRLQNIRQWDDVLVHVKQHSDSNLFICVSCVSMHYTRSKLTAHIRKEHAARDVPIISLVKKRKQTYFSLAVVFAKESLSFSTIRNCFCCEERGMKGDAFISHLKRYHFFVLNYYCEWCNLPIESLQKTMEHYQQVHTRNTVSIRCEMASKHNITVVSLDNFEVRIEGEKPIGATTHQPQQLAPVIKSEVDVNNPSNDDSIIILEDDDIVAETYVKHQEEKANNTTKPKLKCIAMTNLLKPTALEPDRTTPPEPEVSSGRTVNAFPRIKVVAGCQPKALIGSNAAIRRSLPQKTTTNCISLQNGRESSEVLVGQVPPTAVVRSIISNPTNARQPPSTIAPSTGVSNPVQCVTEQRIVYSQQIASESNNNQAKMHGNAAVLSPLPTYNVPVTISQTNNTTIQFNTYAHATTYASTAPSHYQNSNINSHQFLTTNHMLPNSEPNPVGAASYVPPAEQSNQVHQNTTPAMKGTAPYLPPAAPSNLTNQVQANQIQNALPRGATGKYVHPVVAPSNQSNQFQANPVQHMQPMRTTTQYSPQGQINLTNPVDNTQSTAAQYLPPAPSNVTNPVKNTQAMGATAQYLPHAQSNLTNTVHPNQPPVQNAQPMGTSANYFPPENNGNFQNRTGITNYSQYIAPPQSTLGISSHNQHLSYTLNGMTNHPQQIAPPMPSSNIPAAPLTANSAQNYQETQYQTQVINPCPQPPHQTQWINPYPQHPTGSTSTHPQYPASTIHQQYYRTRYGMDGGIINQPRNVIQTHPQHLSNQPQNVVPSFSTNHQHITAPPSAMSGMSSQQHLAGPSNYSHYSSITNHQHYNSASGMVGGFTNHTQQSAPPPTSAPNEIQKHPPGLSTNYPTYQPVTNQQHTADSYHLGMGNGKGVTNHHQKSPSETSTNYNTTQTQSYNTQKHTELPSSTSSRSSTTTSSIQVSGTLKTVGTTSAYRSQTQRNTNQSHIAVQSTTSSASTSSSISSTSSVSSSSFNTFGFSAQYHRTSQMSNSKFGGTQKPTAKVAPTPESSDISNMRQQQSTTVTTPNNGQY